MAPPVRSDNSSKEIIDNSSTSITSPIRRIPSFIDEEDDITAAKSPSRLGNSSPLKSSPNGANNKRKRNHHPHPHENNFGQLNRSESESSKGEEGQSKRNCYLKSEINVVEKRMMNSESPGSPLRKKVSKQNIKIHPQPFVSASSSWGSRLWKFRLILEEHRRNCDFEAWSRDLWQLGNWWLEVAGEEAAGIVFDLVDEFKKEQAQSQGRIMIPIVCGDLFLDKLQAKALVTR